MLFRSINAMDRNKYIYAMADYAFVAQSDTKGGTWTGAVEELKRPEHHPVYVYMGESRVEGCAQLVGKGGIAWTAADSLQSMIKKANPAKQPSLFDYLEEPSKSDVETLRKVSETVAPYIAEES